METASVERKWSVLEIHLCMAVWVVRMPLQCHGSIEENSKLLLLFGFVGHAFNCLGFDE